MAEANKFFRLRIHLSNGTVSEYYGEDGRRVSESIDQALFKRMSWTQPIELSDRSRVRFSLDKIISVSVFN